MSTAVVVHVHPLSLTNICDGKVVEQFDAALERVAAAFEDESLQEGRDELEATVTVTLKMKYRVDSRSLVMNGVVAEALPKRRKVGGVGMLREGRFLVEPDTQQDMPFGSDRAERGE